MQSKLVPGLILAAAAVAVFFLLGGPALFGPAADVREGGPDDPDAALRGADGAPQDGDPAAAAAPGAGPTLFGRARSERQGRGGLQGRVLDFEQGAVPEGVQLTLAGTGYGGETVAERFAVDGEGRFQRMALPAGDAYVLKASDAQGRTRTLPSVSIDAEGVTDLGTLWLGKRGTLRGRVVDEAGEPIADAEVQVHVGGGSMLELLGDMAKLIEQLDKDAEPVAQMRTEADGRFAFESMAPGPLQLVVRAIGFRQTGRAVVMSEDGAAGGEVRIPLQAAEPIHGIVVDEGGRPVGGARVACLEQQDMTSIFFGRQFTETGADGRFTIASPPRSDHLAVIVTAAGYPTLFTQTQGTGEQRFTLFGGTEVLVRVRRAGTRAPVVGAQLMAMFAASDAGPGSADGMTFATGTTDAGGETTFMARPGKLQMLYLSHPEQGTTVYAPTLMAGMGGAAMLTGPEDPTVAGRRVVFDFELGTGITITGRVTDERGEPIAGARCTAMGAMGLGGAAHTDADGRFELKNQGPPVQFVLVSKPGYVQDQEKLAGMMGSLGKDGAEVDITLLRAASVTGSVRTADGRPAAGARIKAQGEGGRGMMSAMLGGAQETIANAEGRYVLDGVHPGAKTRVVARLDGHLDGQTEEFTVDPAGATQAPELVLARGLVLAVTVLRPDGRPARRARVEVDLEADGLVRWNEMDRFGSFAEVQTGADGRAEVPHVPEGTATLFARLDGFAPGRIEVAVPARSDAVSRVEARVQLRTEAEVAGRVEDDGGAPLAGAWVIVQETAAPEGTDAWVPTVTARTDEDGRFTLRGLPGLRLTVQARAEGHREAEVAFTPGLGELVLRLTKRDATTAARLEEIDAELQAIYRQFASVKDDAARNALVERMNALTREKARLESGER